MNKGFISLFIVLLIGLLASLLVVSSASKVWMQSKNVSEIQLIAVARFNAISCIHIARQKIFLDELPIEGEYFTGSGNCSVEQESLRSGRIFFTNKCY